VDVHLYGFKSLIVNFFMVNHFVFRQPYPRVSFVVRKKFNIETKSRVQNKNVVKNRHKAQKAILYKPKQDNEKHSIFLIPYWPILSIYN
jgi:hypothetical protein